MLRVRHYSISKILTGMNMLVSGAALLLACGAFFAYDLITFRQAMVRHLSTQAQIIGSDSVSALLFNDPHSAENTLSALKAAPNIVSAGIYTPEGQPFAAYWRDGGGQFLTLPPIPSGQTEAYWFKDRQIVLVLSIVFQGKPTGTVYMQSDLQEMYMRLKRYAGIAAIVLSASLLAALLVSAMFQRALAEPIVHLAETARIVSRDKKYSARATPTGNCDELATLIEAFNQMLSQIQERDAALQKAHDELEHRVQERTTQLGAANKELEAFSYSVAHDLRAPLRQIDGFSQILADQCGPQLDLTAQRYLKLVRDGARNMGQLVDDLLNMARIGRQELVRKPTDLNLLLQSALRDLQPEWQGRQVDWRIGNLHTVECDPGLMKLVFVNLLSNAVKYTRRLECAAIEVGQIMLDGAPVVFVRDNGAGFEQQYAHKLFGVFQRLHRTEDFEGTGVGLATVHRIIQKHGGQIWAEAEVNKGATFFFSLAATSHGTSNTNILRQLVSYDPR